MVSLALDGRVGQYSRSFLEGSCREERVGRQGGLRDSQKQALSVSRLFAFRFSCRVGFLDLELAVLSARQETCVARVVDLHLRKHLAYDDLDVLVVDVYALVLVYSLNLLEQVLVYAFNALQSQDVLRIQRTCRDVAAGFNIVAFGNCQSRSVRNDVLLLFLAADDDFRLVIRRR